MTRIVAALALVLTAAPAQAGWVTTNVPGWQAFESCEGDHPTAYEYASIACAEACAHPEPLCDTVIAECFADCAPDVYEEMQEPTCASERAINITFAESFAGFEGDYTGMHETCLTHAEGACGPDLGAYAECTEIYMAAVDERRRASRERRRIRVQNLQHKEHACVDHYGGTWWGGENNQCELPTGREQRIPNKYAQPNSPSLKISMAQATDCALLGLNCGVVPTTFDFGTDLTAASVGYLNTPYVPERYGH